MENCLEAFDLANAKAILGHFKRGKGRESLRLRKEEEQEENRKKKKEKTRKKGLDFLTS